MGNTADVTVHDRAENRALPVYQHQGRYYVVGRPGNEYQIRVRNRSGADVLAVVSVDGVNAVSGETANWSQTGYVLAPHQAFDIKGWRKSLRARGGVLLHGASELLRRANRPPGQRRRDRRGGVPQEARARSAHSARAACRWSAATLPPSHGAGRTHPRRTHRAPRRAMPRARRLPRPEKSASLGTGHGRSETSRVTYTQFERATAHPEEVVAIHYDTYANLVALGVIRGPRIATPSPFPGQFVPDPR